MSWNPALPQLIRQNYLQIFGEFQDVFAPHTGGPPVLLTGEPYRITLKPGYRPRFCPKPKWSPQQAEFWRRWATQSLASGGWTFGHGLWASRPIAVLKKGPDGKLAEDFDVRPWGAYVEVNDETEQEPVDSGSPPEELRQTLGDSIPFFGTDGPNYAALNSGGLKF
jgi:hypothetical protein